MPTRSLLTLTLAALATLAPTAAAADAYHDDLAYAVQENSNHSRGWVVSKLMTLKLGPKCWAKVNAKKSRAMESISAYANTISGLAEVLTGDDWSDILGQGNNSREKNREIVEKMVDDFKSKFHLTVYVEGDDCEAAGGAMWLKTIGNTTRALENFPPKSGKAFVTINVLAKAKGSKTEISKDGTRFTITGARDIEQAGWADDIEKAIKRVSTKN